MNTTIVQWVPDAQSGRTTQVFEWLALRFFMYTVAPITLCTFCAWYVVYWRIDREEKRQKRFEDNSYEMKKVQGLEVV